jgi:hypothetical protein
MQAAYADLRSCREHRGWVRSHPFLTFFGMAAIIPIAIVSIIQWRTVRQAEVQAELTRDLLDKGLTVAEVERLLQAADMPYWERRDLTRWSVEYAKIESNLKRELAQMGLGADEIDRVVKSSGNAFDSGRGKLSASAVDKFRKEANAKKDAAKQMQNARQADHEAAIRELIRRGWSSEEIDRLLSSKPPSANSGTAGAASGQSAQPAQSAQ